MKPKMIESAKCAVDSRSYVSIVLLKPLDSSRSTAVGFAPSRGEKPPLRISSRSQSCLSVRTMDGRVSASATSSAWRYASRTRRSFRSPPWGGLAFGMRSAQAYNQHGTGGFSLQTLIPLGEDDFGKRMFVSTAWGLVREHKRMDFEDRGERGTVIIEESGTVF